MTVGFIGGSGIYEALPLENTSTEFVKTPFGEPSAPLTVGELAGEEVVFVPRHGEDHQYSPTEVPYRANVHALKQVGAERVLSSNAVGSLREDLPPRTLAVPDQIFDRTRHRTSSFFGEEIPDIVVHMSFADPYCPHMVEHLAESARATGHGPEEGGTYVCIEGPQYSTRAESEFYRAQDWDVIGMTAIPEAKLAREAELCYATVAGVTDYDVWKADSEVTLQEVLANAAANEDAIEAVIEHAVRTMPGERECDCEHALEGAINTTTDAIPRDTRERVGSLIEDYL